MAAREVQIGQRTFQSAGDAWRAVREVLNSPPLGSQLEGDALAFISDLMLRHPNAEEKIGPGIAAITVVRVRQNRGFWITRTDGTEDNFSIKKCLDEPAPPLVVKRLAAHGALRKAIDGQLKEFRAQFFRDEVDPRCEVTDVPLRNDPQAHVDHLEPRFVELADAFIETCGGVEQFELVPADDRIGRQLADAQQVELWSRFHAARARLRVISAPANLRRTRS